MADIDLLQRLALALAIGFLIGLERGWKTREEHGGERQAGIRTFTLYGVLGGLTGVLSTVAGDALAIVLGLGVGALIVAGYVTGVQKPEDDRGMTTEVAAFVTFVLGALAVRGDMIVAAASAVAVAVILDIKHALHQWVAKIEAAELGSFITLLVISIVLLPVLPNEGFGPGGVLNPYELWWVVVLISAASFAGYLAIKTIGARSGTLLMGVMGGVASSTALTVSASRLAARSERLIPGLAGAISAASAVMFVRILVISAAIAPVLGRELFFPFAAASAVCAGFAYAQSRQMNAKTSPADLELGTLTDLGLAMRFVLFLAIFGLAVYYTRTLLSEEWVLAVAGVSGLVDVDAITVTMARAVAGQADSIPLNLASGAVLVATAVNMVVKAAITRWIGGHRLFTRTLTMTLAAAAAAAIVATAGFLLRS